MLPHTLFLVIIGLFSATSQRHRTRSIDNSRALQVYAKLQARIVPLPTSTTPTRTVRRSVQPAKRSISKREGYSQTRVYAALKQCLEKVHPAVADIGRHCEGNQTQEQIIPPVQEDLRKILAAVQAAAADAKNCEGGPVPSGSYAEPPGPGDVCKLLLELISCLASIVPTVTRLIKSSDVSAAFGDLLVQITDGSRQIISSIDSHLPGTISHLAKSGEALWKSLRSLGFGFSAIADMIQRA